MACLNLKYKKRDFSLFFSRFIFAPVREYHIQGERTQRIGGCRRAEAQEASGHFLGRPVRLCGKDKI